MGGPVKIGGLGNRTPAESYQFILNIERGLGKNLRVVEDGNGNKTPLSLSEKEISVSSDMTVEGKLNGVDIKKDSGILGSLKEGFDSFKEVATESLVILKTSLDEVVKKLKTIETGADKTTQKGVVNLLKDATLEGRLGINDGITINSTSDQMEPLIDVKDLRGGSMFVVDNNGSVSSRGAINGRNLTKDGNKLDNIQKDSQKNDGRVKADEGSTPGYLIDSIVHGDNINIEVKDGVMVISATPQKELPPELVNLMNALEVDSEGNIKTKGKVNGVDMQSEASKVKSLYYSI